MGPTGPRIGIGAAREWVADKRGRVEVYADARRLWLGVDVAPDAVYVCPLPLLVFRVSRGPRWRLS